MATDTVSIRCSLLVNGYMRNEYNTHGSYDQFEISVIKIIVRLLGNIFMVFDVYPLECKSMFSDDGLIFKPNPEKNRNIEGITFGCSYGWNKGIHKIAIRSKNNWTTHAIGITNNIQQFAERPAWYGNWAKQYAPQNLYYNLNGTMLVGTRIQRQEDLYQFESQSRNDVITIKFDGDNGALTFLFNDKIIVKSVKVKKNETYYPFVSYNLSKGAGFELVL